MVASAEPMVKVVVADWVFATEAPPVTVHCLNLCIMSGVAARVNVTPGATLTPLLTGPLNPVTVKVPTVGADQLKVYEDAAAKFAVMVAFPVPMVRVVEDAFGSAMMAFPLLSAQAVKVWA